MDPAAEVNDAINSYGDWSRLWLFDHYVKTRLAQRQSAQALFEEIRREALDDSHWQSPDLAACTRAAALAVRAKFPAINEAAANAIANAASHEWK